MSAAMSVTPMPRADYRAKPHPRPTKWRRASVQAACERAVARELGVEE